MLVFKALVLLILLVLVLGMVFRMWADCRAVGEDIPPPVSTAARSVLPVVANVAYIVAVAAPCMLWAFLTGERDA